MQEGARARQARQEGFQADWQPEEDRRRLLELTGLQGQEEVVREVRGRLQGYRALPLGGSACTGPGPSMSMSRSIISCCFRVML